MCKSLFVDCTINTISHWYWEYWHYDCQSLTGGTGTDNTGMRTDCTGTGTNTGTYVTGGTGTGTDKTGTRTYDSGNGTEGTGTNTDGTLTGTDSTGAGTERTGTRTDGTGTKNHTSTSSRMYVAMWGYSICWVFLALHHKLYLCICTGCFSLVPEQSRLLQQYLLKRVSLGKTIHHQLSAV